MYTTDCNYFRITNYNNVQTGYYRWTGCTDIISVSPVEPLQTSYVCAKDLYVEDYAAPLDVVDMGLCPSTTPTPTVTPTPTQTSVTPTPTQTSVTPTQTPTPTVTPVIVYRYNLRTGGYYQNVCGSTYFGNPANVTIYAEKQFGDLQVGDNVYGDSLLTIPPIGANFTISDGSTFIQIGGTLIINKGICG
jgi:hypothetical protein